MAHETTTDTDDIPSMDYNEHETTYFGFLKFGLASTLATATVLVTLVMMTYGAGVWPKIFGILSLVFGSLAFFITMISDRLNWVPGTIVLGFATLITLIIIL